MDFDQKLTRLEWGVIVGVFIFTEGVAFRADDLNDAIRNVQFGDLHAVESACANPLNAFVKNEA